MIKKQNYLGVHKRIILGGRGGRLSCVLKEPRGESEVIVSQGYIYISPMCKKGKSPILGQFGLHQRRVFSFGEIKLLLAVEIVC